MTFARRSIGLRRDGGPKSLLISLMPKVLLSLRDPEAWYKSMSETIYQPMKNPAPAHAPELVRMQNGVRKAILAETFENRFEDKAHTIEVFNRHKSRGARHYRTEAAPVFDVREGWSRRAVSSKCGCRASRFRRSNDTASTQATIRRMRESIRKG